MENRKSVNALIVLSILMITTLALASGCQGNQWVYFHDEEIRGYVVDADTNKPIEGAIVVSMWQLSQMLSQGFGGYAKVIEVKTDKEGKFTIHPWKTFKPLTANSVMRDFAPEVMIYKPGYKVYRTHKVLWEGYPNDYSRTEEEKNKLKIQYNINPVKLKKVESDKDRLENYNVWGTTARFPDKHFSREQSKDIFDALEEDISNLSKNSLEKYSTLKGIRELREFWAGGKRR
jgi:hypothetical protein